ncbi:HNH endonuclease [Chitinophaga agrisoli]|uniref:HNH endonuclease n=1 Tax=Chitinophaga agrisoli TaxID=2607653 RepID=A0A5B2VNY1_9BACT|nr:HNH endonuclease [Chitinophaga agrisoli]KAA2239897.1 HNH endonuclease [Chitinophaga agrisoli]
MQCYSCNTTLNRRNKSIEHIIPNAIGGKRKAYNLLCKTCNEAFGQTIDNVLAAQLGRFGYLLNIPLDRGTHPATAPTQTPWVNPTHPAYYRAIAKICLNYYLSKGYPRQYCEQVKAFVKGEHTKPVAFYYFPDHIVPETEEVSHIIHLHGNNKTGVLYAYIELFNMQQLVVIFSMAYEGEDIDVTYCRDVVKGEERTASIRLGLTRQQLESLPSSSTAMEERMSLRYQRLLTIIADKQRRN